MAYAWVKSLCLLIGTIPSTWVVYDAGQTTQISERPENGPFS